MDAAVERFAVAVRAVAGVLLELVAAIEALPDFGGGRESMVTVAELDPVVVAPARRRPVRKPVPDVVRHCGHCGKPLVRRVKANGHIEERKKFLARRFCDRACAARVSGRRPPPGRVTFDEVIPEGRVCQSCGKPLERKVRKDGRLETLRHFARRRFCDQVCAGRLVKTERARPTRYSPQLKLELSQRSCEVCGRRLVRHQFPSGRVESWPQFAKRVTCDHSCGARLRHGTTLVGKVAVAVSQPLPQPTRPSLPVPSPTKPAGPKLPPRPVAPPIPVQSPPPAGDVPRWRPPPPPEPPIRMVDKGPVERCPKHGDTIGVYGCPACNAGEKWRKTQGVRRIGPAENPTRRGNSW